MISKIDEKAFIVALNGTPANSYDGAMYRNFVSFYESAKFPNDLKRNQDIFDMGVNHAKEQYPPPDTGIGEEDVLETIERIQKTMCTTIDMSTGRETMQGRVLEADLHIIIKTLYHLKTNKTTSQEEGK